MKKAFKARLEAQGDGGAWTIVRMPFEVQEVFGTQARVAVKGTLNSFAFRSARSRPLPADLEHGALFRGAAGGEPACSPFVVPTTQVVRSSVTVDS